jgi:hypothetical protein
MMSGGHFSYLQNCISYAADDVKKIIDNNDEHCYSQQTIDQFKTGENLLRAAAVYLHRIDWLVSCDDGEEDFHDRLSEDLDQLIIHMHHL